MTLFPRDNNPALDSEYLGKLASYLKLKGWQIAEETTTWYEFLGEHDINGQPLHLVLPRTPDLNGTESYVEKAIDLLAALSEEPATTTMQRVQFCHSDVLVVSNLETGSYQSIPLRQASNQINKVKTLIAEGARTERNPRPYFSSSLASKERMLDLFRFSHTVRGSFGLTIESPIVHNFELFSRTQSTQPPLFANIDDYTIEPHFQIAPLERRIMERIVRGLLIAKRATTEHSIKPLVEEYGSGFSGNMCDAIAGIARDREPIEYRFLWSPRIPAPEDIVETQSIRLDEESYILLEAATQEMKRIEPEYERIRGTVTHVGSRVAPLGDASEGRSVVVRRIVDHRASHNIIIPLNKEDYLKAHQAHIDWSTIEVTGIVQRVGSNYRLINPSNFVITNPLKGKSLDIE